MQASTTVSCFVAALSALLTAQSAIALELCEVQTLTSGRPPLSGAGSDLTVVAMNTFCGWGSSGEIAAFSVGSTSCNAGTKVLRWNLPGTTERALLGQNMYRMTEDDTNGNHRFEQIGMAWVKCGFS